MKVLILGDGKLATEIIKMTGWDYISRKKDGIDFKQVCSYQEYFENYDVILNCIAYTNTVDENRNDNLEINYIGVMNLVDLCEKLKKKLVHISTDYVYANSKSEAAENDVPVHEQSWYAYSKLLGDAYVQARCTSHLLIRTSFKPRPYPYDSAWIDILTNADYIDVIAKEIIYLINLHECGVYNIGTEMKTYYDLAKQTRLNVQPVIDNHKFKRPHDVTMSLYKFKNLKLIG